MTASTPTAEHDIVARLAVELDDISSNHLDDGTVDWVARHTERTNGPRVAVEVMKDPTERPVLRTRAMSVLAAHIQAAS